MCCVTENFWRRKSLWKRWGEGGVSKPSFKKFLSYSTETFRRVTILCCVSEKFEKRKCLRKRRRRGSIKNFPSKNFCPKVTKISVRESFILSLISRIQKIFASEDYVTIFRRKVFVSQ